MANGKEDKGRGRGLRGIGCGPHYPAFATGPFEEVLVFNNTVKIILKTDAQGNQFFSSKGFVVDLCGNKVKSAVATTLPTKITPQTFAALLQWPPKQPAPFDQPPVDFTNSEIFPGSYTKQSYAFEDGSSLVTVGASMPKISPLKNGGAQFWVGSLGAVTQGTGKYKGARGVAAYDGSAYFEKFPLTDPVAIQKILEKGFPASVGIYFKVVPAGDLVTPS